MAERTDTPLAYFITFTTYGTWLQGRNPGWIDRDHNDFGTAIPAPDAAREAAQQRKLKQEPYTLDAPRRDVVLQAILGVAAHRAWRPWAVHVRTNHVHLVISAAAAPEKIMSDMKAWSSRRIRETFSEGADRNRWTEHGSTIYLWKEEAVIAASRYVVEEQGEPMAVYDGRHRL